MALAPVVIAWPRLFRPRSRNQVRLTDVVFPVVDRPSSDPDMITTGSWNELNRLRQTGAI